MNSEQIQEAIYQWALGNNFTAPYGVLKGLILRQAVRGR
jgi:hypothetical protein